MRMVDGPQCIGVAVSYVPDSLFLTIAVRFLLSDTSRERRVSINTATKHVFSIGCNGNAPGSAFFILVL
jgi:hypothetical protein